MANTIKHRGIVERIEGMHVQVRIVQTSACAMCSAKHHCRASESKEKLVDVFDTNAASYRKGEEVMLSGSISMGMQAVVLAFGVPFLVVLGVLFLAMRLTGNELRSAVFALLALVPYYFCIYIRRGKLMRRFSFTIEANEY